MKKIIFSILFILPFCCLAQSSKSLDDIVKSLKKEVVIDSTDTSIVVILDRLFEEGLQSDVPNYSQKTLKMFQEMYQEPQLKNMHIMALFVMYQNHITQSLETGKSNPKLQIEVMKVLNQSAKEVFGRIPVLLYVYQIEAYNAGNKYDQAKEVIKESRTLYPYAIPLKVYDYLNTKDENLKREIVQRHANHWLVKQYKIVD